MHQHDISGKKLSIAIILNLAITLAQVIGGILASSLSLLSDALHNFSDVMALLISWFAHKISHKKAEYHRTFGYRRAEIIAALFNASVLIGIGIFLIYEAVKRLYHPEPVGSVLVIIMGLLGIIVNGGTVFFLHQDAKDNLNIKAAYLHMLGDVLTSLVVVVGGILMLLWGIYFVDALISIIIALYLIYASFGVIKESIDILMEFAPLDIDIEQINTRLCRISGVDNIHHVHLWRVGEHDTFLEAHIDFNENVTLEKVTEIIEKLEGILKEEFGISHTTLQPEFKRKDNKSLVNKQCGG